MKKAEFKKREQDILYFIYRNKIVLIRHIRELFFNTYIRAKEYLLKLEKKGLLNSTYFYNITGEKVYFLSYQAIKYLELLKYDVKRYKVNRREFPHDIAVIDLVIYFIKKYNVDITTDYLLRRERAKKDENKSIKIPDFIFTTKKGLKGLVEYQLSDKPEKVIKKYIYDYIAYYSGYAIYYIVEEGKVEKYKRYFEKYGVDLDKYFICSFDRKIGLKIHYKKQ